MHCNQCGQKNQDETFFCIRCNSPLGETPSFSSGSFGYAPPKKTTFFGGYPTPSVGHTAQGDATKNWAAITGFALGVISFSTLFTFWGILFGLLAIVFSAIGLKSGKRSLAVGGLTAGIISVLLIIGLAVLFSSYFFY